MAALAAQPADVVIADPVFLGAAFLLGHPRPTRPPVVMCGIIPLPIESRDTAPYGMGLRPARFREPCDETPCWPRLSRRVLRQALRGDRRPPPEVHGVDMPISLMDWGRHAEAIVQFTRSLVRIPDVRRAIQRSTSSARYRRRARRRRCRSGGRDLDGTRPVVHVTQGTVANTDYGQAIEPTLRALADEDVLVVVSTGGRPVEHPARRCPRTARAATVPSLRRITAAHFCLRHQWRLRRRPVRLALRCADRRHRRQGGQARGRRPSRMVRASGDVSKAEHPTPQGAAPRHPRRPE